MTLGEFALRAAPGNVRDSIDVSIAVRVEGDIRTQAGV